MPCLHTAAGIDSAWSLLAFIAYQAVHWCASRLVHLSACMDWPIELVLHDAGSCVMRLLKQYCLYTPHFPSSLACAMQHLRGSTMPACVR